MGVSCYFVSRTNCKIQASHSLLATLKNVYTWIHDSGMCFGSVSIRLFQSKVDFALLPLPSPPKEGLILSCFLIAFRAQYTEFCPILMKIIKPLLPSSNMVCNTFNFSFSQVAALRSSDRKGFKLRKKQGFFFFSRNYLTIRLGEAEGVIDRLANQNAGFI